MTAGIRERLEALGERHSDPGSIPLLRIDGSAKTDVERYWGVHTVHSEPFRSAAASLRYLDQRAFDYPLFEVLMAVRADHTGDVVLDYGCGPGNDLVSFAVHGHARRVIGIDVSSRSLELARSRLALHGLGPGRAELLQVADGEPRIPLASSTIDHVYCEGVLHHTSHPEGILRELRRVVRGRGRGHLMVYNRESIWFHLFVAYQRKILDGAYTGLSVDEAFERTTDGEDCPIARPYGSQAFVALCEQAGFRTSFLGGYFNRMELNWLARIGDAAIQDERLDIEHRDFLRTLSLGDDGYPTSHGKYAGIGGVYSIEAQ